MANPNRLHKKAITLYLEPEQQQRLQALSRATHVPQQWYLREGLNWALAQFPMPARAGPR
jgi:predicted DNA-binding protein